MKNILVTGAGGYIGTTLVPMLLEQGYRVRALDRYFFGDHLPPRDDRIERVKEDSRRIRPSHLKGIDAVIDLVALSNDPSAEHFQQATWQINCESRIRTARLAKEAGIGFYLLPSSCSVYGFVEEGLVVNENSPTHPLTTYAKANKKAEEGILALADADFCAVVLRLATVFGCSPRMRFDLAINNMSYSAWKTGELPLMRSGRQWRPMVHVKDVARAVCFMLKAGREQVRGQIYNVGSEKNSFQLIQLAELVSASLSRTIEIEWYGDDDHRSYRVSFDKIEKLGYRAEVSAEDGIREIGAALETGKVEKSSQTLTLPWYQEIIKWQKIIHDVELCGGILDIENEENREGR